MSDAPAAEAPPADFSTAGAMLRAARERQGVHIAVLASSIKVARAKLEALENDRYDELPDMTFTRALARTVCRALKIEPEPVLARLPQAAAADHRLAPIGSGLNEPFRERGGRSEAADWSIVKTPFFWAVAVVLLAAVVLYLLPEEWLRGIGAAAPGAASSGVPAAASIPASAVATSSSSPAAEQSTASAPVAPPAPATSATTAAATVETVLSAPAVSPAASKPARMVVLSAGEESWVEVSDASGQVLLSRTMQAGDEVGLDGTLPMRVKIGNAAATTLRFRGQPVDLARSTRDNVARLELK